MMTILGCCPHYGYAIPIFETFGPEVGDTCSQWFAWGLDQTLYARPKGHPSEERRQLRRTSTRVSMPMLTDRLDGNRCGNGHGTCWPDFHLCASQKRRRAKGDGSYHALCPQRRQPTIIPEQPARNRTYSKEWLLRFAAWLPRFAVLFNYRFLQFEIPSSRL